MPIGESNGLRRRRERVRRAPPGARPRFDAATFRTSGPRLARRARSPGSSIQSVRTMSRISRSISGSVRANARTRSVRVTIPMSAPSASTTGSRLIPSSVIRRAASATLRRALIVTADAVIARPRCARQLLLVHLATTESQATSRRSCGSGPASFATMSASETTPRTSSRSPMTGTPEMVLQKDRRDVLQSGFGTHSDRIPCHEFPRFPCDRPPLPEDPPPRSARHRERPPIPLRPTTAFPSACPARQEPDTRSPAGSATPRCRSCAAWPARASGREPRGRPS